MKRSRLIHGVCAAALLVSFAAVGHAAEDNAPARDFSAAANGLKLRGSVSGDASTSQGKVENAATGAASSTDSAVAAPPKAPAQVKSTAQAASGPSTREIAEAATAARAENASDSRTDVRSRALAQNEKPPCRNPNALGVSRVVEIDTTGGPQYGKVQYKNDNASFLREREVVLTFDDGPLRRHTLSVLEELSRHCTLATFFAVGRQAVADADMLRKVHAAGHTIGHHTWSHLNQHKYSFARTIAEFELGVSTVSAAIGVPSAPFFRFPYLADPSEMRAYVSERNFGIFSIDIDSYDFRTRSGDTMRRNTMSQVKSRGRGIILFHDIQTSTARGLGDLLDELKSGGYKIVHMVAKHDAETLPEYDEEARTLHEKRSYTARARPLKTSFRFDGRTVPTEALPAESRVTTTSATGGGENAAPRSRPEPIQSSKPTTSASSDSGAWKRRVLGLE